MEYVIETKNLTKRFDRLCAVDGLNLQVPSKTIFALLGPNGAGKTTTVRLLNGILRPTLGRVSLFGEDVQSNGSILRQRCGVQTDTNLYDRLTVLENLKIWGMLFEMDAKSLAGRIEELLKMFGLTQRRTSITGGLSKGMKQKLAIARAVIHRPEILFLDEPTAGLDPETTEDVLQYLKRYVEDSEHTVFLCSHRLEEVELLSREVAILYQGRVLASGSISELIASVWKEKWVWIELEELTPDFMSALEQAGKVLRLSQQEKRIGFRISDRKDIPGLVAWISDQGGRIFSVREEVHSLKDTYIQLLSQMRNGNES